MESLSFHFYAWYHLAILSYSVNCQVILETEVGRPDPMVFEIVVDRFVSSFLDFSYCVRNNHVNLSNCCLFAWNLGRNLIFSITGTEKWDAGCSRSIVYLAADQLCFQPIQLFTVIGALLWWHWRGSPILSARKILFLAKVSNLLKIHVSSTNLTISNHI